MTRYLIIFIFLLLNLDASIIKKVEIFETNNIDLEIKDIKNSSKFKKTVLPIERESKNIHFIKITFDKKEFTNDKIIELNMRIDEIEINEELKTLSLNNQKAININEKDFIEALYIKTYNDDGYINFDIKIYDKEEYLLKQITIGKFFGIAYGIIFAAFLYYFALYLFNRDKGYIYYSLTQLSVLLLLIFVFGDTYEINEFILEMIILSFFIFLNLFTKSFLNTKKISPKSHIILNFLLYIYILDTFSGYFFGYLLFGDILPKASLFIFYLIAAIDVSIRGYRPALFYLVAWGIVTIGFISIDVEGFFFEETLLINPLYIVHTIIPIESLILAFALSYKMKLLEKEKEEQRQFLTYQSKLASMGEMIGNIAHQWRQPLNHLSYIMMNLKTAFEKDKLNAEYFDKKSKLANAQLKYMSHTIDDFRDFFRNSKQKEIFNINEAIDEVINLLKESFKSYDIELQYEYQDQISTNGYKGEFLQVLFNILNNAKDEFIKKEIENPKINIKLHQSEKIITIEISDNAGGIDNKILNKIFEPYFTTKDKGLGIGLYMSKMIIERESNNKLEASNIENGTLFSIILNTK